MAKQTFTTGQVLTAAQMTSLQQTAMLGGDANARTASYVLAASDAGNAVSMNSSSATTITVNTGIFAAGDIVTIINLGTGVCTITAGTATVATAATLALAQNEGGILRFTSASAAIFFEFATPQTGDITAVTAGTGLSGGGTSGDVTLTNTVATAFDAKGDLVVGTGADTFAKLTVGTNGHTLVADSSTATGLKWEALASGGKLLQVVYADTTTNTTVASTTYTDLNLSASITPSSTASKVLIICMPNIQVYRDSIAVAGGIQLLRGSTVIQGNSKLQAFWQSSLNPSYIQHNQTPSIIYLDSPSTTSSTTYKIQGAVQNDANNSQISLSNSSSRSSIVLMEIGA